MVKFTAAALGVALSATSVVLGQQTVLYDFWSPSCGPCRRMEPVVARLGEAGYPVQKVNIAGSPAERKLATQFKVTKVPTFIALADGREVDRMIGPTSFEHLAAMVQRAQQVAGRSDGAATRAQSPEPQQSLDPWASSPPRAQRWPGGPVHGDSTSEAVVSESVYSTSAPPAAATATASELIAASVRIRVGDAGGHGWGTGTIIDTRSGEALVITCGHIFRESDGQGAVTVELFEQTPAGAQVVAKVPGQVITYDLQRDIGLVSIRPPGNVRVAKLAPAATSIKLRDNVASVGCDHGANPTVRQSHVTAINRYLGSPNVEVAGAPVEGRSGGGLFNAAGELIGICYAADPQKDEGLYAALAAIHDQLASVGLSDVVAANSLPPATNGAGAPVVGAVPAVYRGQEPLEPVAPATAVTVATPAPSLNSARESGEERDDSEIEPLDEHEQAAWDEIAKRAATSEVICIVRPQVPGGKSEIISLGPVSNRLVRKIRATSRNRTQ